MRFYAVWSTFMFANPKKIFGGKRKAKGCVQFQTQPFEMNEN